jgi:hypothetical protein
MMKARDCGLSWDIFLLLELLFVQGLALELKQDFLKQYLVLNVKCSRTIAVGNDVETANMKEQNHRLNPLTFHRISLPNHRFLLEFIPPFIFCSSFNQQVPSNLQQFQQIKSTFQIKITKYPNIQAKSAYENSKCQLHGSEQYTLCAADAYTVT